MTTLDLPPLSGWSTTTYGPAGVIEVPEPLTFAETERLRAQWSEAAKDPSKPFILSGGARFVPFGAYEQEGTLSETLEVGSNTPILLLAFACIANAIGLVAVAAGLVFGQ